MAYLRHHYELNNNIELTRMQQRAKAYQIIRDELYKTSVTGLLHHCLSRDEGKELLTQTHSSVCGGRIGTRALTAKVFKQGFFWFSIVDDASKLVTTCQACQKFRRILKHHLNRLSSSHLRGCRWGINIVGPLATTQGNYKYAVVVVEYFTK
jgi:hypothetical protein